MRSRYTAFALRDEKKLPPGHLHPRTSRSPYWVEGTVRIGLQISGAGDSPPTRRGPTFVARGGTR